MASNDIVVAEVAALLPINPSSTPTVPTSLPLTYAKPFLDVSKIEVFANDNFKRWQERIFSLLDVHGVSYALTHSKPPLDVDKQIHDTWLYANKVCHHTILQTISCVAATKRQSSFGKLSSRNSLQKILQNKSSLLANSTNVK